MPLGNPIRKQNESRILSVLATEGQTVFTVQGGYIVNRISVFRNGVRLSNAEDFTAGDGSTVTLNNAANIDDRIEFHVFDRFTVSGAIVSAASTQTISGDVVVNGKIFGNLDVPSINTGIGTFGGTVSIADSIVHTGDTDTSIRFPTADTITAETAGSERLRITANTLRFNSTAQQIHLATSDGSDNGYLNIGAGGGANHQNRGAQAVFYGNEASSNEGQLGLLAGNSGSTNGYIYFNTAGSERLRIKSTGLVGIGTVNPARILHLHESSSDTVQLHITNSTTGVTGNDGVSFALGSDESLVINQRESNKILLKTADTDRMTVDANGRVLINDSSARGHDGGNNPQFQVSSNASGNWARISSTSYIDSTIGGGIILGHSRNGTIGSHTVVQNGDKLGSIFFEGSDGTDFARGARIESRVDGTPGDNDMPGRLEFYTTSDGAATETERLRIKSNGSVNIGLNPAQSTGTNTTNAILTVKGYPTSESSAAILALIRGSNTTSIANNHTLGRIVFGDKQAGEYAFIEGEAEANASVGDTPGRLVFSTAANSTSAPTERMRINSEGRLIIGTTSSVDVASSAAAMLQVEHAASNLSAALYSTIDAIGPAGVLALGHARGSATGVLQDDDVMGQIRFAGGDGTDLETPGAQISGEVDGTPGSNDMPGRLVFSTTADGASTTTERMRITSGGDVLIADTSNSIYNDANGGGMNLKANGQLVLKKAASSASDPLVWLNDTGQTTNKFIVFAQDGTERANLGLATKTVTINSTSNNSIATLIRNNGTTGGHGLKITSGGTGAGTYLLQLFSHNQSSENERLRVDANGHLMLGAGTYTNYGGRLKVFSSAANDAVMNCVNTATGGTNRQIDFYFGTNTSRVGSIQSNSSATAFNTSSDYRLKENAVAISDGITRLKTLKPYRFNFKIDASRTVDGFFAHEVTAVPEAITGTKDEVVTQAMVDSGSFDESKLNDPLYQEIDQSKLVPLLTAALQEAVAKIETLETKVAALEGS